MTPAKAQKAPFSRLIPPSPEKSLIGMYGPPKWKPPAQWLVLAVTPSKILFLLRFGAFADIHMTSMGFTFPTAVETYFSPIPDMIIIVIAVVNSVASAYACRTSINEHR